MPPAPTNQLLASLPIEVYERVVTQLELRPLHLQEHLSEPDAVMTAVYFPLSGVVSVLTLTEDGESIETMVIGNEGVVGFRMALSLPMPAWQAVVQGEGEALTMALDTFMGLFNAEAEFRRRVLAYCGAFLTATTQSVACNRFHDLSSRTARWLLLMHDRMVVDEFRVTHAFMGLMLGVHRPAVTVAMGALSAAGLIQQRARGLLLIADRRGLEDAACECYARATGFPSAG